MFFKDSQIVLGSSLAVTTAIAGFVTYKYFALQKRLQQKDIYETNKSLSEYLLLHYGLPNETLLLDIGDKEALDFPKRCAEICLKHSIKAEVCSQIMRWKFSGYVNIKRSFI